MSVIGEIIAGGKATGSALEQLAQKTDMSRQLAEQLRENAYAMGIEAANHAGSDVPEVSAFWMDVVKNTCEYMAKSLERNGLSDTPSMREVQASATELFRWGKMDALDKLEPELRQQIENDMKQPNERIPLSLKKLAGRKSEGLNYRLPNGQDRIVHLSLIQQVEKLGEAVGIAPHSAGVSL